MTRHEKEIAKTCRKRAEAAWGKAWNMLSSEQQQGAVAKEVISVLLGLHMESDIGYIIRIAAGAMYPNEIFSKDL